MRGKSETVELYSQEFLSEDLVLLPDSVTEQLQQQFNHKYRNFYLTENFDLVDKPCKCFYHEQCYLSYLNCNHDIRTEIREKIEIDNSVEPICMNHNVFCIDRNCIGKKVNYVKGPRPKKGGATKSEIPFVMKDDGYVKFDDKELMIEVLLACQGVLRKEMIDYFVSKGKCLPFVTTEHPKTKMTYSESQVKDLLKMLNITGTEEVDEIISKYEHWEMNYDLPSESLKSSDVTSKPFEYDMSTSSDPSANQFIDVKNEIISGNTENVNSYYCNSEILRTQFLCKIGDKVSVRFLLTDTGSNMTVCSAALFESMGGNLQDLAPVSDVSIATTNGTNSVGMVGLGTVELYSVYQGKVVVMGTIQVYVTNTSLNEFILGTDVLNKYNFQVSCSTDQSRVSFTCRYQNDYREVIVSQIANQCLSLPIQTKSTQILKPGLHNILVYFPCMPFNYQFEFKSRKFNIENVTVAECKYQTCNKSKLSLLDFYFPVNCQFNVRRKDCKIKQNMDIFPYFDNHQVKFSNFYNNYSDKIYGCSIMNDTMDDIYNLQIPSFDDFKERLLEYRNIIRENGTSRHPFTN